MSCCWAAARHGYQAFVAIPKSLCGKSPQAEDDGVSTSNDSMVPTRHSQALRHPSVDLHRQPPPAFTADITISPTGEPASAPDADITIFIKDGPTQIVVLEATVWRNTTDDPNKRWQTYDILKQLFVKEMTKRCGNRFHLARSQLQCWVDKKPKPYHMLVATDTDIREGTMVEVWPTEVFKLPKRDAPPKRSQSCDSCQAERFDTIMRRFDNNAFDSGRQGFKFTRDRSERRGGM